MYVPFFRSSVQVVLPVPLTGVSLATPGPTSRKPCEGDASVTMIEYFPVRSRVTGLPSWRSVMNWLPTVPCRIFPPSIALGTRTARFGSEVITPYFFVYAAS